MSRTIVVTWPHAYIGPGSALDPLERRGWGVVLEPKMGARSPAEVQRIMSGANAAIVSTDPFPADVLDALPDLRVISRMGVGVDSIDVPAATERGVLVTTTPGANHAVVAEHTLAMILALVRRLPQNDASMRAGNWDRAGLLTPRTLSAMTVGIVGMGRIGQSVAQMVAGFGAKVIYSDPFYQGQAIADARQVELSDLLRNADLISLHVPSTPQTKGLLDSAALENMKSEALIVNTGRGDAIVESALIQALEDGTVAGAALDVFENEPDVSQRLLELPNVLLTPHTAALSPESIHAMMSSAVSSVEHVLDGGVPATAINPEAVGHVEIPA